MTPPPPSDADKSLGDIVQEVSEKASLLVREEIELAKVEVTAKAKSLGKGAVVGAAAGVFAVFAVVMALNTFAWLLASLLGSEWLGFLIVTLLLLAAAAVAGLLAKKWLSSGAPTPDQAIEEARLTRQTLERQSIQRDQLGRAYARRRGK